MMICKINPNKNVEYPCFRGCPLFGDCVIEYELTNAETVVPNPVENIGVRLGEIIKEHVCAKLVEDFGEIECLDSHGRKFDMRDVTNTVMKALQGSSIVRYTNGMD